ncbi:unnamed protein product [Soboliphyme baturini]|uniref:C2H2-type domain-containing protein n=1 Tax=Soboliphyme baturini TaxID=241478 RepID=A0A183J5X0_9BILA|nr:unnamed protein product [Soboliphyme baturini]
MELLVSSSNGDLLSDCSDSNAVLGDESLAIDDGEDDASGDDLDTSMEYGTSVGKLNCQLCGVSVADNPSSLGLHVRNHLQYKPSPIRLKTVDRKQPVCGDQSVSWSQPHSANGTINVSTRPSCDLSRQTDELSYVRCTRRLSAEVKGAVIGATSTLGLANGTAAVAARR